MSKESVYRTLGASSHVKEERAEHDYYATDPKAVEVLLQVEQFHNDIWEPACGGGHISKVLADHGHLVTSTDLVQRDFGVGGVNFLDEPIYINWPGDIITNPPYKFAQEFIEKALSILQPGRKVAMLLKIQFLEGKKRKAMYKQFPPKTVYVSSSRLSCAKNGDFEGLEESGGSAIAYAWYVWEKGYTGKTIVDWVN